MPRTSRNRCSAPPNHCRFSYFGSLRFPWLWHWHGQVSKRSRHVARGAERALCYFWRWNLWMTNDVVHRCNYGWEHPKAKLVGPSRAPMGPSRIHKVSAWTWPVLWEKVAESCFIWCHIMDLRVILSDSPRHRNTVIPACHGSDISSDILSGILSDILSGLSMHIFWPFFWHSIWPIFWHSFWQIFWHSICRSICRCWFKKWLQPWRNVTCDMWSTDA